jgi:hypothetical protein
MIDYIIKKEDNCLYIVKDQDYLIKDIPIQRYFNSLLIDSFTNLQALEKAMKKLFAFNSKIPIYVDEQTLFMNIKSYRLEGSIYINYFAILSYYEVDKEIVVSFYDGHCLKLKSRYCFYNQIKKCQRIIEHLKL